MKENGMNKLLELLNEYDDGMVSWYEEYFSTEGLFVTNAGQGFREEFILSKRYGFIKWLVENDKIDLLEFTRKKSERFSSVYISNNPTKKEYYTECLLMLLSIQDNPIKWLCEILK